MAAVFAELNRGESVTSGLRKVTADMKTKNRSEADRTGAAPTSGAGASRPVARPAGAPAPGSVASLPPKLELLQGQKWSVEHFSGRNDLVIADTAPKQTVYIYSCHNCTIQVQGKVNAISLDRCSKVGLLFESVVSSVELVNCCGVDVQSKGGLYLPEGSLECDVTTAKSSGINIVVLPAAEDGTPLESPVPEQFVTRWLGGKWVTEPVSHSAG